MTTPGKIFLAEQQGRYETESFTRLSMFNFGSFFNPAKTAFGRLYAFNQVTLNAGCHYKVSIGQNTTLLLLPVTGMVSFSNNSLVYDVDAGNLLQVNQPPGSTYQVSNGYESEQVLYLEILLAHAGTSAETENKLVDFSINNLNPALTSVLDGDSCKISLGRFQGREEALYHLPETSNAFIYAISGACEIEGRLLHPNDGLALWATNVIDVEALSNNALLLVLELV